MNNIKFYPHQQKELDETKELNKVAYYHDMGLGKTFTGAEKAISLKSNILLICQKSKIQDWFEHFEQFYNDWEIVNLTDKKDFDYFFKSQIKIEKGIVFIINYELAFRRKELFQLKDFTLMLDESSMIQNENAKRSKFILKLNAKNIILLSGTPTSGKYEKLWSQLHLLGWKISKDLFWKQYVDVEYLDNDGFPIKVVRGYKNVERLKQKMRDYGCRFLKTEDVFDLPLQNFNNIYVDTTKEHKKFKKDRIITFKDIAQGKVPLIELRDNWEFKMNPYQIVDEGMGIQTTLVGDTTLTKMLYERMLCGQYNVDKLEALQDLLESSEDRIIIFYNFNEEALKIVNICEELDKPYSIVNGKGKDLSNYEECDNSVTLIQYQAGAMGLNLQKANKIIYFTPTLNSELFEQSKKRIHRIGQDKPCFYYKLICRNSIEEKIYRTLEMRKNYTKALFEMEEGD